MRHSVSAGQSLDLTVLIFSLQAANSYLRDQWFHSLQWKVSPDSLACWRQLPSSQQLSVGSQQVCPRRLEGGGLSPSWQLSRGAWLTVWKPPPPSLTVDTFPLSRRKLPSSPWPSALLGSLTACACFRKAQRTTCSQGRGSPERLGEAGPQGLKMMA